MKLQQYLGSFNEPLRTEDVANLIRLLSCRNKTARGLSDTIGPVDVRLRYPTPIYTMIAPCYKDAAYESRADDTLGEEIHAQSSSSWITRTMGLNSLPARSCRPRPLH